MSYNIEIAEYCNFVRIYGFYTQVLLINVFFYKCMFYVLLFSYYVLYIGTLEVEIIVLMG